MLWFNRNKPAVWFIDNEMTSNGWLYQDKYCSPALCWLGPDPTQAQTWPYALGPDEQVLLVPTARFPIEETLKERDRKFQSFRFAPRAEWPRLFLSGQMVQLSPVLPHLSLLAGLGHEHWHVQHIGHGELFSGLPKMWATADQQAQAADTSIFGVTRDADIIAEFQWRYDRSQGYRAIDLTDLHYMGRSNNSDDRDYGGELLSFMLPDT